MGQGLPLPALPRAQPGAVVPPLEARVRVLDSVLPQTQCRQCGYDGCLAYARALAAGGTAHNRCPPGGTAGVAELARLLGRDLVPLDPGCGEHQALQVARIDEAACIGCMLCIRACPVDAIAGAVKRMHTVVAAQCTGCALCLPPCPTDCIRMEPVRPARAWTHQDADAARARMHARSARLQRAEQDNAERLTAKAVHKLVELSQRDDLAREEIERRQAIVARALARARARRAAAEAAAATETRGAGGGGATCAGPASAS